MYVNVFLNMTNIFSHQKKVYRGLGITKILKNTRDTTEKVKYIYIIMNLNIFYSNMTNMFSHQKIVY